MRKCLKCSKVFISNHWNCPLCGFEPKSLNKIEIHAPKFMNFSEGFKPEYFSELIHLENSNFWFQARNKLIIWLLSKYKPNASNFHEVGCGNGFVLSCISKHFPNIEISGSEIYLTGLSYASIRIPTAQFMQMDAKQVPFFEEFDAIGAFDVLEHIKEDEKVLAQLHDAIKPGGVLLLTVPQHPSLWSASDDYACHERRYTCKEIEQKVSTSGFELLRSSSFMALLSPVMMLSRIIHKRKTKNFDHTRELKINSILNKVFYFLMMLELFGIKFGINYPIGGSRFIVARKKVVG